MKSLKKFFALCLTLALVLSLAACAQKPAETTDPAETPDTPAQETEAPVTARASPRSRVPRRWDLSSS